MAHEPAHSALDLADPHHDLHHAHVIISPRTLLAVLLTLLVFTVLTVAASRAEIWVAETFNVVVPQVINVGVVLFIAVIKSTLVAMYFMQLKYDSVLNSIIFLFCIFALALFLFFSMLDLSQRGIIYSWKGGEIQEGGMGINTRREFAGRQVGIDTEGKPITLWARQRRINELASRGVPDPEARFEYEKQLFAHHGHAAHEPPALSTPNRTLPRAGLTPGLFSPAGAAAEPGHGHGH